MSTPPDILSQILQGGLMGVPNGQSTGGGLLNGLTSDPTSQFAATLAANSNTPGNFIGILGKSLQQTQQNAQSNAQNQLNLLNTGADVRQKLMMQQMFQQAYPGWLQALTGGGPGAPQSAAAPQQGGQPSSSQPPPSGGQSQGTSGGMDDPFSMLRMGMIGSAMGMPGAAQMIEVAKARLQYDPQLQTKIEAAKSTVAQDQELIDQALRKGDTATAWGMTQKLQQDMGLIHIASMSGTQTRITPQGVYTMDPNTGIQSLNGVVSPAPGAVAAKQSLAAAQAVGGAAGDLVERTDDAEGSITGSPGATYYVPKSSLLGGGGAPRPAPRPGPVPPSPGVGIPGVPPRPVTNAPLPTAPVAKLGPAQTEMLRGNAAQALETNKAFQQEAETGQQMVAQVEQLKNDAAQFTPGPRANERAFALKALYSTGFITADQQKSLGAYESGQKIAIQLQAAATKQLGSREAAQVFSYMGKSLPNMTLSQNGLQNVAAWQEGISKYNIARARAANGLAQANDAQGVNQIRDRWIAQSNPLFYVVGSAPRDVAGDMLNSMGSKRMEFLQGWVQAYRAGFAPPPPRG